MHSDDRMINRNYENNYQNVMLLVLSKYYQNHVTDTFIQFVLITAEIQFLPKITRKIV